MNELPKNSEEKKLVSVELPVGTWLKIVKLAKKTKLSRSAQCVFLLQGVATPANSSKRKGVKFF